MTKKKTKRKTKSTEAKKSKKTTSQRTKAKKTKKTKKTKAKKPAAKKPAKKSSKSSKKSKKKTKPAKKKTKQPAKQQPAKKKTGLNKISLKELLEAGCHFGHQAKRWNPKMEPYIWKKRQGIHIFDLAKTAEQLKAVCQRLEELAKEGKAIVFVGTKRQAQEIVRQAAKEAGVGWVSNRWLGGTITNWKQIKKSIDKLKTMKKKKEKGEYEKYTKKENVLIDREIGRLTRFFEGLLGLEDIPDAIFVVDVNREIAAVKEARMRGVEVLAIVDSNADPDLVDWVIPANDDAVQSIKLIVARAAKAIALAKEAK